MVRDPAEWARRRELARLAHEHELRTIAWQAERRRKQRAVVRARINTRNALVRALGKAFA